MKSGRFEVVTFAESDICESSKNCDCSLQWKSLRNLNFGMVRRIGDIQQENDIVKNSRYRVDLNFLWTIQSQAISVVSKIPECSWDLLCT